MVEHTSRNAGGTIPFFAKKSVQLGQIGYLAPPGSKATIATNLLDPIRLIDAHDRPPIQAA